MSFGKGGGTTITTAQPTAEQTALTKAQVDALTGTFLPSYKQAVEGAQTYLNNLAPTVGRASENLQGTAIQTQASLGETGESALRTGISGLESLFGRDYEQQQINAALAPAQAQYQQNLAGLQANFGGTGNLGSARQALAERALAGTTQSQQAQTAAQVASNVAAQRAQAASTLAGLGQGGLGQALGAAGQGVTAAMAPQQLYNQYASILFGTPSAQIAPDFRGTQGYTKSGSEYNFGIGGSGGSTPFKIGF